MAFEGILYICRASAGQNYSGRITITCCTQGNGIKQPPHQAFDISEMHIFLMPFHTISPAVLLLSQKLSLHPLEQRWGKATHLSEETPCLIFRHPSSLQDNMLSNVRSSVPVTQRVQGMTAESNLSARCQRVCISKLQYTPCDDKSEAYFILKC